MSIEETYHAVMMLCLVLFMFRLKNIHNEMFLYNIFYLSIYLHQNILSEADDVCTPCPSFFSGSCLK